MRLKPGNTSATPGMVGHDIGRRRQEDNGTFSERRHKKVSHLSGRVRPDWGPGSQEEGWGLKLLPPIGLGTGISLSRT